MNRPRTASIVTFLLLAGLLIVGVVRRTRTGQNAEATPQDAVYGMLSAARAGDIAGYLDEYTGRMETDLKQAVAEKTEAAFRSYLQSVNAEVKGVAVFDPKKLSDREAEVRVEYVFQDRNEAQTMYLVKIGERWKIARVDGSERVKTLVPYGTPVE